MTSRRSLRILLGAGIVAPIVGIGLITFGALPEPASFGWSAYAPLPHTVYIATGAHAFSTMEVVGFIVLVVGLLALAFWGGHAVGSRRSTPALPIVDAPQR
jgi:hypothetical protein